MKQIVPTSFVVGLTVGLMVLASNSSRGDQPQLWPVPIERLDAPPSTRSPTLTPLPPGADVGSAMMPIGDTPRSNDLIEQELRFQRALAESLKGQSEAAIQTLAEDDDTAAKFARAILLMKSGAVAEGVDELEAIESRLDAPKQVQKFLAVGYLHLNRPGAAEAAADEYLDRVDEDPYMDFLLGFAIARQQEPERAVDALRRAGFSDREVANIQQVAMQYPVDVQQRRSTIASTMDTAVDASQSQRSPGRRLNFTLLMAGEYDSNVALQPQFSGLGANLIDREDYRFLLASFLDLQLLSCETYNLGIVGSTYNTFQFESNDYDIQDYMVGGYGNTLLSENLIGSIRYEYHHTLVAKKRFADEHRLTPSVSWLRSRGHTTLFYEFNPIDSRAPALIPAQIQTASINRIGLTQAFYTSDGNGRLYGGYQFADASADGSDFDRTTHMVTGRWEQPLGCVWIGDLDVRYVWDGYDNPNSLDFFDRPRDDKRLEIRAGLQRNFDLPIALRFDYTYINNDSNTENLFGVRFYDYDRHIFSTQLIFTL